MSWAWPPSRPGEAVSRSICALIVAVLTAVLTSPPAEAQGQKHAAEKPEPAAGEEAIPEGELRVKAESYEQRDQGHMEARGTVDLRLTGTRVLADRADVYEDKQPDGSVKRRLVADGNVVFIRGEERLSGDHLEMDDTGKGFMTNAVGYVEPGVFVEGRRVTRQDDKTYLV